MSRLATATAVARGHSALLGFAVIAGLGWLLDALLLVALVLLSGLPSGWANAISSLTAAAFVYVVSHSQVHRGREDARNGALLAYLIYSIVLIATVSSIVELVFAGLRPWMGAGEALIVTKIAVTPPQFALNFVISRRLARAR